MEELIGKKLGQYHIEAKIGEGGMAVVFKAYQTNLKRYVALKVLPPSFAAQDPDFTKRFQREAESIARLNHPNILPVYDFGVARGYSYIAMRYVEGGQTLNQVIRQPLSQERAIELISQIGNALAYAHKEGIIHRDLKPSNVLIDNEWALLSDFGLAKISEASIKLTGTGMSLGTPAYMSPEQAQGGIIDHRIDIYALGIILYEMLTGTIPHKADTPLAILHKRSTEPPLPPRMINPNICKNVEQVILRALAMKPEERYDSAADFIVALQKATVDEPSVDDEETIPSIPPLPIRRASALKENSRLIWVAGVAAIAIFGGIWFWSNSNSDVTWQPPSNSLQSGKNQPTSPPVGGIEGGLFTKTGIAVNTPTSTPTWTPTSTPIPPTDRPTSTPSPSSTPSATNTPIPPTGTPTITPVLTPTVLPHTPTTTPSPTPSIPIGTFTLLKPLSLDEPTFGLTDFEWEWVGNVPPDVGFEVRVWREGEPQLGVHNAVLDNGEKRIRQIGENKYSLTVDISEAPGVLDRQGEYLWTVALIQISPDYADLGQQAEPARLRFEAGGRDSDGGGGGDGDGSSSSSSGGGPVIH